MAASTGVSSSKYILTTFWREALSQQKNIALPCPPPPPPRFPLPCLPCCPLPPPPSSSFSSFSNNAPLKPEKIPFMLNPLSAAQGDPSLRTCQAEILLVGGLRCCPLVRAKLGDTPVLLPELARGLGHQAKPTGSE